MPRKRRRSCYEGCSVSREGNRLRLRYRVPDAGGGTRQASFATGLEDTPENRRSLEPTRQLVGRLLGAGKDPAPYLAECFKKGDDGAPLIAPVALGPTVESYFREWLAERQPQIRAALARDYRRHFEGYILPALGDRLLADLRPRDIRGLKAELLARVSKKTKKPLSEKFVKNILCGSFQAMAGQARVDEIVTCDLFARLQWGRYDPPAPDPLTADERDAILAWFKAKRYSFHAGRGEQHRLLPHPHYHAYVHFLFWHGARPSEASGLRWGNIDLAKRHAHVRQSYHMGRYGKPKTRAARRVIELHPDTVQLLRPLQPSPVTPDMPVFTNIEGRPVEPKSLSEHWYECLRALGIRQRGLYATKDTFVTLMLGTNSDKMMMAVVRQTGVALETLRRHYENYLPKTDDGGMWAHLDNAPAVRAVRKRAAG